MKIFNRIFIYIKNSWGIVFQKISKDKIALKWLFRAIYLEFPLQSLGYIQKNRFPSTVFNIWIMIISGKLKNDFVYFVLKGRTIASILSNSI